MQRLLSLFPVMALLALIMSGCQYTQPPRPSAPAPYATVTPISRPVTPTPASAPAAPASSPITLTVWLPDTLVPPGDVQASAILTQQITAFATTQPDIRVQVLVKRAHGSGGILNLMQAAAPVAPSFLPDVTLLDLTEIPAAAQAGLLHPLNGLVPDETLADLFPFAASAGFFQNQWMAIACSVDMEHVAYNSARASSPPLTWPQVMSGSQPYLFPAGAIGGMPSDALMAQYAAAGGRWLDDTGRPSLDEAALAQMLRQLKDAQQFGMVPASALSLSSPDETWMTYLGSPVQLADVRASRFLAQRGVISGTMATSLPGYTEPARPIVRGSAFVVPTHDPTRASTAAALVAWLMAAENQGAYTRAAKLLPTRQAAFDHWYPPDSYTAFIRQELGRAIAPPPDRVAQIVGPAIQKAVADVLRNQAQPADAAKAAVETVARPSK